MQHVCLVEVASQAQGEFDAVAERGSWVADAVVMQGLLTLMWRCAQIVLTIHQPSSDICERFDDLILLSCGRMLYCGPWGDADSYFASAGFECAHTLTVASSFARLMPVQTCMLNTLMAPEQAVRVPSTARNASMHWVSHLRTTECVRGTQEHSCTSVDQRHSS